MRKNLKDMLDETKGLLLIDRAYNTILIPMGSDEMHELYEEFIRKNIRLQGRIKQSQTLIVLLKNISIKNILIERRTNGRNN